MVERQQDVIVVGGGAAGIFAALACAADLPGGRVLVLERGSALLRKVKVSGGGRCNVTHAAFDPQQLAANYPRGGKALRGPFTRFQPGDTVDWFERRGVRLKTEADGRIFPASDTSQTIIDCLLDEAGRLGVDVRARAGVERIRPLEQGFALQLSSGQMLYARRVLLATGGERGAWRLASDLGHTILPPVPSLFTFAVQDPRFDGLPGVAASDAIARLPDYGLEQRGPLLITHWGLSGPAVLKLSAWGARALHDAGYAALLRVNWAGAETTEGLFASLLQTKARAPNQIPGAGRPPGGLPERLWKRLVAAAGIAPGAPWNAVSRGQAYALAQQVTRCDLRIRGKGAFKEEFVTCGGVALDEVNFKMMESRLIPGLHFAGEVLDIDGVTGGFNFQAAWTTGWIAGKAMAAGIAV